VQNPPLLEISVETVGAAVAAERGGADRIELCHELAVGGLTPGAQLMRATREQVRLPIFAMIRPRGGNFVYCDAEFDSMRNDIAAAKRHGMNGMVLGILKQDRRVDVERTRELVELARPLAVTFHRAFDESVDLHESLEDVIKTGAARILTSGGVPTAPEGLARLAKLVATAGRRIIIVPGSGLNASNILRVARETKAREFHSGLSSVRSQTETDGVPFEAEVRRLASELARV
jgi:copper homeostasis protein